MPKPLSPDRLREALEYDVETGVFTWKLATSKKIRVGQVAGCPDTKGYILIGLDNEHYLAHRLAWLYVTGKWPENKVDHRNGDGCDNSWDNLRDASDAVNSQNRRTAGLRSSSGLLGVSWDRSRGKWVAVIGLGGVSKNLGRFDDKAEAYAAYVSAKRKLHVGCTL